MLLVAAMLLSLVIGAYPLAISKLLSGQLNDAEWSVLTQLRAPRVLAACAGGAAFALAGAALQALFRNLSLTPGLLGVPSATGLGAAIALIVVGAGAALWIGALIGAGVAIAGMLFVVHRGSAPMAGGTVTLLLLGIAINAARAAGLALLTALASEGQLKTLSFWMLGSFASLDWPMVIAMVVCTALGGVALVGQANALAALALGERAARTVGVNVQQLRVRVALIAAAMVAVITAFCGGVGFCRLAAPHIARMVTGSSPRLVLPLPALIGARCCAGRCDRALHRATD